MTLRHQRNITITGLLVAVVIVFLVCHSLKLLLNCYEVNTERTIILPLVKTTLQLTFDVHGQTHVIEYPIYLALRAYAWFFP